MSLTHGWTGGQYSVYRALFGTYLFVHLAQLIPWGAELFSSRGMLSDAVASPLYPRFPNLLFVLGAPAVVTGMLVVGVIASLLLALGWRDRVAALVLWYVWACLFTRNPLISNPGLPFVGWLLLAHACLPAAPYGSWAARGRIDPGGGWRLPDAIFAAAWIVMAVGYSYSGLTKLMSPSWLDGSALVHLLELARPGMLRDLLLGLPAPLLAGATWGALAAELAFAPLALFARVRRWLWLALLAMHCGLALIDFADLSIGMLMLQLFSFDPGWIASRRDARPASLFYDGSCGLCHGAVRFLLAVPDSIVVLTADGELHSRTGAVIEIGRRLGGLWRLGAIVLASLPRRPLDATYDAVARVRHRLFERPEDACPRLPASLRERFRS